MSDLPNFQKRSYAAAQRYAEQVFTRGADAEESALRELTSYDDGHFRAIFDPDFFVLQEDRTEPSKSQWNTLKKRMKRIDRQIFVFKEHGKCNCGDENCYYVDFGFLADRA